jgi:succinoglycan biosynthesis transport protein ExoP
MEQDQWEGEPSLQPTPKGWAPHPTLLLVLDYWRVIVKHWYIIVGLTVLVAGINAYRVLNEQSVYFSQVSIEVRPGRLALGEPAYEPNFSYTQQSFIKTQMTVATSRAVGEVVVDRLGVGRVAQMLGREIPVVQKDEKAAVHNRLVDALLKQVKAEQMKDTFIILIGVESNSPKTAALLANTWAQSLTDFNREIEVEFSQNTSEALTKQVERLQASIKEKEARLTQIAGPAQIQVLDQQLNVTMQNFQNLSGGLQAAEKDILEKQSNFQRIQRADPKALPEVNNNSVVASLTQSCAAAQQDYTEQSKIFKPDWPGLQKLKVRRDDICERLNTETRQAYDKLVQQSASELEVARSKGGVLRRNFDSTKEEIESLNKKTSEFQALKADIENEKHLLDEMMQRRQTTQLSEAGGLQGSTMMRIVERATPSKIPIRPKRLQSILIGLLLGLGLGVASAFVLNLINLKIHSHEEIERITSFRFLAFIPDMEKESHVGIEQNAFRFLTKHLAMVKLSNLPPRVILITSAEPKEGKTFISSNLALTEVSKGKRTLLIDTDIHRPSIHGTFNVPISPGLADLLVETGPPDFDIFPKPSANLTILPSGQGNTDDLVAILENSRFVEILRAALRQFDYVIIDSGPILVTPETVSIAQNTDGVILVVRSEFTTTRALKVAADLLNNLEIRVLGTVLNKVDPGDANSFYHYYKQHAYTYYGNREGKSGKVGAR